MNIKRTVLSSVLAIGVTATGFLYTNTAAHAESFNAPQLNQNYFKKFLPILSERYGDVLNNDYRFDALYFSRDFQDTVTTLQNRIKPKEELFGYSGFVDEKGKIYGRMESFYLPEHLTKLKKLGIDSKTLKDGDEFVVVTTYTKYKWEVVDAFMLPKGTVTIDQEYVNMNIKNMKDILGETTENKQTKKPLKIKKKTK
ncbi:hypothetical protein [Lysinibacillus piscis]|uniref:DUF3993 domain-containing protein n=1 Tax=Lysinibacillus piscis TaxID=2518931 RepID=A0ABQ5NMI1_9BACI|nr:hypothetical protein [Lysinibacillus sp. KH24]GLC89316.1 hypothetical protein LYSBPC_24430 [Lysinibacillus sp. KH24]